MKEQLILKLKILELQRKSTLEKVSRLKDQITNIDKKAQRLQEEIRKIDQSATYAPRENNNVAPRSNNF